MNFLNHRFHTIGKYVQNYRYRLSTDMANIGPIPIIGQSLTNLSIISSSYNKSVKTQFVATCHLQTCYNLQQACAYSKFGQSTCYKSVDNLQQTCHQQLSQAMWTHHDIILIIKSIDLMHKSWSAPCILGNGNLRIFIGFSLRRVTNNNA